MTTRTRVPARASILLAGLLLSFAPGGIRPALAHAHLRSAQPPVDGTARGGDVREVRITFSEGVEPRFCRVSIAGPDGKAVEAALPEVDPADSKVLVVRLAQPLPPGVYTVEWHATAVDTHKTDGRYGFTVAAP